MPNRSQHVPLIGSFLLRLDEDGRSAGPGEAWHFESGDRSPPDDSGR
jgi:hypothetical protein